MKIAVFGLGYVGSVSAACFAAAGHEVIGVDVESSKLDLIRHGESPVSEPGLDDLLSSMVASGRLTVTNDTAEAVRRTDLALVCVGTPSRRNGSLDSRYLERVVEEIGQALADRQGYYLVAIRSTLLPGLLESVLIPVLERASGRRVGADIGVCVNPEFLRESTAIADFTRPPFTIVGEHDTRSGDVLLAIYSHLDAPVHRMRPAEASMVKYASNAYHAVKVAFSNEIGAISERLGIDGRKVMQVFCEDHDLNISAKYLRPGFAFGGSCLPKDVRALTFVAKESDVSVPLLGSLIDTNAAHIRRTVEVVLETRRRDVALLGLSFKAGTDDLRESPFVALAEDLFGKGIRLRIWDPDVSVSQLVGRNRAYVDEHLPHLAELMTTDAVGAVREADVVIFAKRSPETTAIISTLRPDQFVVDLVGVEAGPRVFRPWARANVNAADALQR